MEEKETAGKAQIGVFRQDEQGCGRMFPLREGFVNFGISALARCRESESPIAVIDEIGFLETACPEYCAALEKLFEKKQVIAVLRKQDLPFLNAIREREDTFVLDLDAPFGNAGCVIMASGLGTRFGGNKLLADFRGRPLIAGALEATEDIPNRVVVTRHRDVAQYCEKLGIPAVLHSLPHRSDTVRLGVNALGQTDFCIFCQGDQPLLSKDTVAAMAMLGTQKDAPILRAGTRERFGAPIAFPRRFYGELEALPEGKGGNFLAKKYPEQVRFVPVQDSGELMDVDTPEDLAQLSEQ